MSNRTQRNRQHKVDKADQEKKKRMTKMLQHAVRDGKWNICELALQNGADPNVLYDRERVDGFYGMPLIVLIVHIRTPTQNTINIINSLLIRGARIDAVYENKITALNAAILLNRPKIFKFLIEKGANINLHALRFAFLQHRVRMCRMLRKRGAGGIFKASELKDCSPEMKKALETTSDLLINHNLDKKGPYCVLEYQDSTKRFGYMGDIFGMAQLQYDWENGLNQVRALNITSDEVINDTGTLQVLKDARTRQKQIAQARQKQIAQKARTRRNQKARARQKRQRAQKVRTRRNQKVRTRQKRARLKDAPAAAAGGESKSDSLHVARQEHIALLRSDDTSDDEDAPAGGESKSDSLHVQIQSLRF